MFIKLIILNGYCVGGIGITNCNCIGLKELSLRPDNLLSFVTSTEKIDKVLTEKYFAVFQQIQKLHHTNTAITTPASFLLVIIVPMDYSLSYRVNPYLILTLDS